MFIKYPQQPREPRENFRFIVYAALIIAVACLLVLVAYVRAADDPRLESIQQRRETMSLQKRIGQLLFENATLIEEKLDREEAKIKAEKPKEEKKATE